MSRVQVSLKDKYRLDDDEREFKQQLESQIAEQLQEAKQREQQRELQQLQNDMQRAEQLRPYMSDILGQSQRVLPQQNKIAPKHHEKLYYTNVISNNEQIKANPNRYDSLTEWPPRKSYHVHEFLSVLGEQLYQQIVEGHLTEDEIMPKYLRNLRKNE